MWNTLNIARRELGAYFASPLAYLVIAGFLIVAGVFFMLNLTFSQSSNLLGLYSTIYTILLFLTPMLSMRLFADEQRTGTIELLLTAPVRDWEVVLGKFLGAFALFVVMLALTVVYPAVVVLWGNPDKGALIGSYLGGVLFGAAVLSIGLFASSLTQNQIVAAVVTFAVCMFLWIADALGSPGANSLVASLFSYLGLFTHFNDLSRGVVDTKDIVYFLSITVVALFLTVRSLEARRWKA